MIGRPFGSAMPTRSPRLMPAAASASATACDLIAQGAVGDAEVLFGNDDGGAVGRNRLDQIEKSFHGFHLGRARRAVEPARPVRS